MLRRERHEYDTKVQHISADALAQYGILADGNVRAVRSSLRPVLERRLASLLPLSLYDGEQFADEVSAIVRGLERRVRAGGVTA
jgi:hypothetical protein